LGEASQGDGLRLWHDLLAAAAGLAALWRLASPAQGTALGTARGEAARLLAGGRRQFFHSRGRRWKKSGPNPTDRRRPASKHLLLLTGAQGIPLSLILTGANRHDVTQLLPLLVAIPPVAGLPGAPKRKPALIQADCAYHSEPLRQRLQDRASTPRSPGAAPRAAAAWAKPLGGRAHHRLAASV